MIVTRSGAETEIGASATTQLTQSRNALAIAGVAAIAMGFIPGMPIVPFLVIVATLLVVAWRLGQTAKREAAALAQQEAAASAAPNADTPEDLIEQMRVHALEILLAPDLVDMVSGASDDLLGRVRHSAGRSRSTWDRRAAGPHPRQHRAPAVDVRHPDRGRRGRPGHRSVAQRARPGETTSRDSPVRPPSNRSSGSPASGCRPSSGTPPR